MDKTDIITSMETKHQQFREPINDDCRGEIKDENEEKNVMKRKFDEDEFILEASFQKKQKTNNDKIRERQHQKRKREKLEDVLLCDEAKKNKREHIEPHNQIKPIKSIEPDHTKILNPFKTIQRQTFDLIFICNQEDQSDLACDIIDRMEKMKISDKIKKEKENERPLLSAADLFEVIRKNRMNILRNINHWMSINKVPAATMAIHQPNGRENEAPRINKCSHEAKEEYFI